MEARTWLETPVTALDGVGAGVGRTLEAAFDIVTVGDLLEHYPVEGKYREVAQQQPLSEATEGAAVTLIGTIVGWQVIRPRRRALVIAKAELRADDGGSVDVPFFNQQWRPRQTPEGSRVAVSGVLERYRGRLQLKNPQLTPLDGAALPGSDDTGERLQPTYPATEGLASHRIARLVAQALDALPPLADHVPEALLRRHDLVDLDTAVRAIHRPGDLAAARRARQRLVYDELLCLQVGLQQRRLRLGAGAVGVTQPPTADGHAARMLAQLPFTPTAAQRRAFDELGADLGAATPMHRLLQGDVGTGKTLVAAWVLLCAVDHGRQGALMAPTEVLAEQHHRTLSELLAPLGVNVAGGLRVELLTGSLPAARVRAVLAELAAGDIDLLVGTHAMISERVTFFDLGAVVVDEQHRFGVEHRARLRDKAAGARTPDVMVMTATPIPRSLALTLYGDLDATILDERPHAVEVTTVVLPSDSERRDSLYDYIRQRAGAGERAFVVCPLVEPSETVDAAAATTVHERLASGPFADLAVGLVHGRLPASERDERMRAFRNGEIQVLVATTVIEVGLDVPDATIMVIEDANRFGISQLHQLRGRLYRGRARGYCVLFSADPEDNPRLQAMVTSDDGFSLAEADLALRGEGSLFDTRQSGLPDLGLASLVRDYDWVVASRADARELVTDDPALDRHPALRAEVHRRYGEERLAALDVG